MREKTNDYTLSMTLPVELISKIKAIAKDNNISMAAQIRIILTDYCKNVGKV